MLRTLVLAASVLAAAVPLAGSAQTVPSGLNLHNGYIQVNNHVVVVMPPMRQREHIENLPSPSVLLFSPFTRQEDLKLDRWGPIYLNRCCIAAGTRYSVAYAAELVVGAPPSLVVHPRLCNVRGIPFGFAEVTFAGEITWNDQKRHWVSAVTERVDNSPCPKG
jgi:hypothetical protein